METNWLSGTFYDLRAKLYGLLMVCLPAYCVSFLMDHLSHWLLLRVGDAVGYIHKFFTTQSSVIGLGPNRQALSGIWSHKQKVGLRRPTMTAQVTFGINSTWTGGCDILPGHCGMHFFENWWHCVFLLSEWLCPLSGEVSCDGGKMSCLVVSWWVPCMS